jgi:hypothetical protein
VTELIDEQSYIVEGEDIKRRFIILALPVSKAEEIRASPI